MKLPLIALAAGLGSFEEWAVAPRPKARKKPDPNRRKNVKAVRKQNKRRRMKP